MSCLLGQSFSLNIAQAEERRIDKIYLKVNDVFEGDNLNSFYRFANNIKANTRRNVILQELLISEGDVYDEFLVEESERALRQLNFLRRVSITPRFKVDGVDLEVEVQDTWTLFPQFNYSSGSGTNKKSVGVVESNVLGYGKRLELFYADDEGREKIEGVWEDPRVFGTKKSLVLGHFDRSDGFRTVAGLSKPFRSLVDRNSWQVQGEVFDLVGRLFEGGDERYIFRQEHTEFAAGYTFVRGEPEVHLDRYTVGYSYLEDKFSEADEEDFRDVDVDPESVSMDEALLAEDRTFSGPFISYSSINPEFLSMNNIDKFERVEDFNLGSQFTARLQFAAEALDSNKDTLLLFLRGAKGWRFGPTSFLRSELTFRSRIDDIGFSNNIVQSDTRYYNVMGAFEPFGYYFGKSTIASALRLDYADELDRNREFLLGANSGLRGYESRTFTGTSRMLFSIEQRLTFAEDVFRLLNIGFATFLDAGGTSTRGLGDIVSTRLHSDVGFGLRLGFPRSSGGSVLRVDVAFPLREYEPDDDSYRILVTTGQNFRAFLSQERPGRLQTDSVLSPN